MALNDSSGFIRGFVNRSVTSTNYITNNNAITSGAWNCVAMTWDLGAAAGELVNIYRGTLTVALTECTYGTVTDGSGTAGDDSAAPLTIAGDGTNTGCPGDYAVYMVCNTVLTLGQLRAWQFSPRRMTTAVDFKHLGFNGTGTQPDWSGTGNPGTVTSMTVAPHVPLCNFFGRST